MLFNKIIDDLKLSCSFKDVAIMNHVLIGVVIRYLFFFSYLMQWQNISSLPKHIGIDEFKGNCNAVNVNIKMNIFPNLIMYKKLHFYIVIFLHFYYIINILFILEVNSATLYKAGA